MPGYASGIPIGVFRGPACGIAKIQEYEAFLGGEVNYVLDFMPDNPSWADFEAVKLADNHGNVGQIEAWQGQLGSRKLMLAVPACCNGSTWATEASGTNDSHWIALGNKLVAMGFGDATIRLAREFNGFWYPWQCVNGNTTNFVNGWSRISWLLKTAVSGANFKMQWNPYCGTGNLTQLGLGGAWPGDQWVDEVGVDVYEADWSGIYGKDFIKTLDQQQRVWTSQFLNLWGGLQDLRAWVGGKNKPLCYPEWAIRSWNDGFEYHGGGDNPYFINQMAAWMFGTGASMHAYWEDPNIGLSDPDNATGRVVAQPQARQMFLNLFGRN